MSYHIVDLKRQNRRRVGTEKLKVKVRRNSVSDDDVWISSSSSLLFIMPLAAGKYAHKTHKVMFSI